MDTCTWVRVVVRVRVGVRVRVRVRVGVRVRVRACEYRYLGCTIWLGGPTSSSDSMAVKL